MTVHDDSDSLTDTCENLWLRPSGADILWTVDGIAYLRPEVQLLHKSRGLRPKDQVDFEVCAPLLDVEAREWLRSALEVAHPRHVWIAEL